MLYLVNCEIIISYNMSDSKKSETSHIVVAENEEDAKNKIQNFYAKKDIEYCYSYFVNFNYCNEVIS